jgi:hypothetical protein
MKTYQYLLDKKDILQKEWDAAKEKSYRLGKDLTAEDIEETTTCYDRLKLIMELLLEINVGKME